MINDKFKIKIPSKYLPESFSYNMLAAFSAVHLLGISTEKICNAIDNFTSKNSRVITFFLNEQKGILLISKHENSVSYDQSLKVVINYEKPCTVVIIVDEISRKYFTSDTSWLYDIDFNLLENENIKKIIVSGIYCNDLAVCLLLKNISSEKLSVFEEIEECCEYLKSNAEGKIFVITCFSDKEKFLKEVSVKSLEGVSDKK